MAIITQRPKRRSYYFPTVKHEEIANIEATEDVAFANLPKRALGFGVQRYGMTRYRDLFTPRQFTALTTFSDLVRQARIQIYSDAKAAGHDNPQAYANSVSIYLAFAVDNRANYWSTLCAWYRSAERMISTFGRQALTMTWDNAEANPFSGSSGNFLLGIDQAAKSLENAPLNLLRAYP